MAAKILFVSLTSCLLAVAARGIEPSFPPPGYRLVFVDDFSGSRLDETRWMYRTDVKADSSQRPENVFQREGKLVIALRREPHRGKNYTGGGVISRPGFRYGYFEARVKMHGGGGWHQAVWAMHGASQTTYAPGIRTEIDGIEFDSDLPTHGHIGLIRWRGPGENRSWTCTPGVYRGPLGFDATAGFHNYGFEWTESEVRFFIDGELRCVLPYPPTEGEHDRINLWLTAIAHTGLAGPVDEARLPGEMLVEHAAVYQRDLYVDDSDPEYTESGSWLGVTRGGYSDAGWRRSCAVDAVAAWDLTLPGPGTYELALYKNFQPMEGGAADIEIVADGAAHRRRLDFSSGPPGWNSLGRFAFARGRGEVRMQRVEGCVSADTLRAILVR